MILPLYCRFIPVLILLVFNATAYSAINIRESLLWFPVAENIALGMGVEEFRTANQAAKPLTANDFKADGTREGHICYGESLEPQAPKGNLENRLYFSFLQGKLVQVEWKQSGENLNPGLVRGYGAQMAEVGSKLPSEQKSFFANGRLAPFYTATQERYQLKNGTVATLTATELLFTATITDVKYLKEISKEDFFQKLSDDHAIAEWKKEQGDLAGLSEKVIDYLVVSNAGTDTKTDLNQILPKTSNSQSVQPPAPSKVLSTSPSSTLSDEPASSTTPWSIIVILIVAAIGLLWLLLKGRK